jgi:glucose/arabinose dehydrogenase
MKPILYLIFSLSIVMALGSACGQPPAGNGAGEVESSPNSAAQFRVETVADKLQVPWAIAFAPDGRIFFTERPGRVRVIESGRLRTEPLANIADVEPSSESGLMDISLHPQFAANHLLYLTYAYRGEGQLVRVVRFRETGESLTDRKVIIKNIPAASLIIKAVEIWQS